MCGHNATKVIDSRDIPGSVRRRRECLECRERFTTYERAYASRLQVQKRAGRREDFSPQKLARSLEVACVKRPLPLGAIDQMVEEIRDAVLMDGKECVETNLIGEMALHKLLELDRVAYLRYASVYRDFNDPERFAMEADRLRDVDTVEELLQGRLLASDALHELHRRAAGK